MLLAQLRGEIAPNEKYVEFWIDLKLISLRTDVSGVRAEAAPKKVKIPISQFYAFLQFWSRLFGGDSQRR